MTRRRPWRRRIAAVSAAALGVSLLAAAQAPPEAAQLGSLSGLFEENPDRPFCLVEEGETQGAENGEPFVTCKPAAVSVAVAPDGSLLYWNGIENTEENVDTLVLFEAARVLKDSRARTLDLSGDAPVFTEKNSTVGATLDEDAQTESYETPIAENPLGVVGIGKAGDGFTGSTVGRIVSTDTSAPSDDPLENDHDMFCSDLVTLPDGTIMVAGGSDFYSTGAPVPYDQPGIGGLGFSEIGGVKTTSLFTPGADGSAADGEWSVGDAMEFGRWYPTSTTLPDGDVLTVSGVTRLVADSQLGQVRLGELYDSSTGEWSTLRNAGLASEATLPMYPRVHLAPSGDLFYGASGQMNGFGPTGYGADEALWGLYKFFDVESQSWEIAGATQWAGLARNGNFSTPLLMEAPFDTLNVLQGGGTLGSTPGSMVAMGLSEIITIDEQNNVTSEATETLNNPRWFSSGTLLPDGKVLASGGGTLDHVNASGFEAPVRQMELFDPASRTWEPVLDMQRDRIYHNSATLLQDGRVLIGGHSPIMLGVIASHQDFGGAMASNQKDPSFEIYSPPYLHTGADRPEIASAPGLLEWGEDFAVRMKGADAIDSFSLVRTPNVSHTVDSDQRGVKLDVVRQNGANVTADFSQVDGTTAPPGQYYLFANKQVGDELVPSIAAIVTVGGDEVLDILPDGIQDADAFLNNSLDTAATAEAGDAQPLEEGNILEGMLDRQWPAPGFEEILVQVIEENSPEMLRRAMADMTPEGMEQLTDILTPLGLLEQLEEAAGMDPMARDAVNDGFDQVGAPLTEAFQEGVTTLGGALTEGATAIAPGALPNPGLDYSMLEQIPVPDEPLLDMGGDETGPPALGGDVVPAPAPPGGDDDGGDDGDASPIPGLPAPPDDLPFPPSGDEDPLGFLSQAWRSFTGLFS